MLRSGRNRCAAPAALRRSLLPRRRHSGPRWTLRCGCRCPATA